MAKEARHKGLRQSSPHSTRPSIGPQAPFSEAAARTEIRLHSSLGFGNMPQIVIDASSRAHPENCEAGARRFRQDSKPACKNEESGYRCGDEFLSITAPSVAPCPRRITSCTWTSSSDMHWQTWEACLCACTSALLLIDVTGTTVTVTPRGLSGFNNMPLPSSHAWGPPVSSSALATCFSSVSSNVGVAEASAWAWLGPRDRRLGLSKC
jgi:hypothetical protein